MKTEGHLRSFLKPQKEPNCTAASWNSENSELLCFTNNEQLVIKAGNHTSHTQKLKGNQRVVGFSGNLVYLIDGSKIEPIQVSYFNYYLYFIVFSLSKINDSERKFDDSKYNLGSSNRRNVSLSRK